MKKPLYAISDLDGCIVHPGQDPHDILALGKKIAAKNIPLSICTGRPQPFVDAIIMQLGLPYDSLMHVCENGAVFFDRSQSIGHQRFHSKLGSPEDFSILHKQYMQKILAMKEVECVELKSTMFSMYPAKGYCAADCYAQCQKVFAGENATLIEHGHCAEVVPYGINKSEGLKELCEIYDIEMGDILYIGDSANDVEALRAVGFPACPANASEQVKEIVTSRGGYIAQQKYAKGVLEILSQYFT